MKPALAFLLALLAAPLAARADEPAVPEPVGTMTPPTGWNVDQGRSRGLELAAGGEPHFVGMPVDVSGQHLMAPGTGAMLLVTEIATRSLPADPAAAASIELYAVRSRLEALGDTVKVVSWNVAADGDARTSVGSLEWTDASLGTTTISRTVVFMTGARLVRLQGECIISSAAAAQRAPCETALATLRPLGPVTERVPLTVTPPPPPRLGASLEDPGVAGPLPPSGEKPATELEAKFDVKKPEKKTDRRPIYVGVGLLIIAGLYLWNRSRRTTLAADEETKEP